MNRIFVEAKSENTPECKFLQAIISKYGQDKEYEFVCMNGFGNLFNESILNQLNLAVDNGDNSLVLLDADSSKQGGGYETKKAWIETCFAKYGLRVPYFFYPDNGNDGDVECLMEAVARKDIHRVWFDCFEDYERCVSGVRDETGKNVYNTPNRKGKLHTYITAMQLKSKDRYKLGSGNWLFDNPDYWDLSSISLAPLLEFFSENLKS